MAFDGAFGTLDAIAAELPFALADMDAAGDAFARWHRTGNEADHRIVDIWTYCFVRRYYLLKFIQTEGHNPSDLEEVIEKAYRRVQEKRTQIREARRYAHWVHVVCKNTYLNYLRSQSRHQEVAYDIQAEPALLVEGPERPAYDAGALQACALRAIEDLPEYIREVARRRLLREESYEDIAAALGKSPPTVRAYFHKAVVQLRDDPALRVYLKEIIGQ